MPIAFQNEGLIPLRAVSAFGVSVKDKQDAIGYFGTGLKYAIAVLLRRKGTVHMWRGNEHYRFFTLEEEMRGKEFQFCAMECQGEVTELPFTTELGKNWEPWMAFRELYCNAVDEEGGAIEYVEELPPECFDNTGHTLFIIEGKVAEDMWSERHMTVLQTKPMHEGPLADAHIGPGHFLYYRGIRVNDLTLKNSMYDYNLKANMELTEDRTLKWAFQARHAITSLVLGSEDPEFIRKVLSANMGVYEHQLDFTEVSMTPGPVFLDTVGSMRMNCDTCNISAMEVHREHVEKNVLPTKSIKLTRVEQKQLDRAISCCAALGCDMKRYPIVVLDHLGGNVWGRAEGFRIYLSRRVFNMGTKMVAGTLFEEYIHLAEKLRDESRDMQNWLIDRLITLYEEKIGEPI